MTTTHEESSWTLSTDDMQVRATESTLTARFGRLHLTGDMDVQVELLLALLSNKSLLHEYPEAAQAVSSAADWVTEDAA